MHLSLNIIKPLPDPRAFVGVLPGQFLRRKESSWSVPVGRGGSWWPGTVSILHSWPGTVLHSWPGIVSILHSWPDTVLHSWSGTISILPALMPTGQVLK